MTTINQLILFVRKQKKKKNKTPALKSKPQVKGTCIKIYIRTPKNLILLAEK